MTMKVFMVIVITLDLYKSFALADEESIIGPQNSVVLVGQTATFKCRANLSPRFLEWTYWKGVKQDEKQWNDVHRSIKNCSTTGFNDGTHVLSIYGAQLNESGIYVCRRTQDSQKQGFEPKAGQLVVVAYPLSCIHTPSGVNDSLLDCRITYEGRMDLQLEWLGPNNTVIAEKRFQSRADGISYYNLPVVVPNEMKTYSCRSKFMPGTGFDNADEYADNEVTFREGSCRSELKGQEPVSTQTPAPAKIDCSWWEISTILQLVSIVLNLIFFIAFLVHLTSNKLKKLDQETMKKKYAVKVRSVEETQILMEPGDENQNCEKSADDTSCGKSAKRADIATASDYLYSVDLDEKRS